MQQSNTYKPSLLKTLAHRPQSDDSKKNPLAGETVGLIRQMKVRGLSIVNSAFMMTMIGWNLMRIRAL